MDKSIFGLRFKSDEVLQPTIEDLRLFLETFKNGKKERHRDDLERYCRVLARVEEFVQNQKQGTAQHRFGEKMVFGILSHSHFFTPTLKSAVEQFKFHYHALASLDFKKPRDFIRAAEEEMKRLNPNKKDEQLKRSRFQVMIDQRNTDLESLQKQRTALCGELKNIALYVKENLIKIQRLCEASITILVGLQVGGEKTGQLIEDIKSHFKEQVRDFLQLGPVTKQYVESLKDEVGRLSKQLSQQVLVDIYAVTKVYEILYDHTRTAAGKIEMLIGQVPARQENGDAVPEAYEKLEQALISLISDLNLDSVWPEEAGPDDRDKLLLEKRREMLDHLFAVLNNGHGTT